VFGFQELSIPTQLHNKIRNKNITQFIYPLKRIGFLRLSKNISLSLIEQAEEKISEVESQLNLAKEKDFSEFDLLHKEFLKNMVDLMEEKLDESKNFF